MTYTYAKSSVRLSGLVEEIVAAGLDRPDTVVFSRPDSLEITYEPDLSGADKTTLDGVVSSHARFDLAAYKSERYSQIDDRTEKLILEGFTFDSVEFSPNDHRLLHQWENIKNNPSDFAFPVPIETKNFDTYSLDQADVDAFFTAAITFVQSHLDSGRALKKQIFDAADQSEVDAVVDNR